MSVVIPPVVQTIFFKALLVGVLFLIMKSPSSSAFSMKSSTSKPPTVAGVKRGIQLNEKSGPFSFRLQHSHGFSSFGEDEEEHEGENKFDIEGARERLESLVGYSTVKHHGGSSSSSLTNRVLTPSYSTGTTPPPSLDDVDLPPPPPLTSIGRMKRETEIELLSRLEDGDAAIPELWCLWSNYCSPAAAMKLVEAEELAGVVSQGEDDFGGVNHHVLRRWENAERILKELIEEYGVFWTEPVNRLATLYYKQGRLEEAEALCKLVLSVKPWHFGTLSGIVMVYAAKSDSETARLWAASRLPPFVANGTNRRRTEWVRKAVESARASLQRAEGRIQNHFGPPDGHVQPHQPLCTGGNCFFQLDADGSSWE